VVLVGGPVLVRGEMMKTWRERSRRIDGREFHPAAAAPLSARIFRLLSRLTVPETSMPQSTDPTGLVGSVLPASLNSQTRELLSNLYGERFRICPTPNSQVALVLSLEREIDLIELETLCDAVGWSRRPLRRVRKALQHSLLRVGLWRHDSRLPRLVGFARCTGDGVVEATVWDVAVHPLYQGAGLGTQLMNYILDQLRHRGVEQVSLFADPDVVGFYAARGWELEPMNRRCAFWYAP
jgi:ribosomal protein S18 acetylase RimI-like enzyme